MQQEEEGCKVHTNDLLFPPAKQLRLTAHYTLPLTPPPKLTTSHTTFTPLHSPPP